MSEGQGLQAAGCGRLCGARLLSGACTAFLWMRHGIRYLRCCWRPTRSTQAPPAAFCLSPPRPHPRWLEFALLNCYGSYPTPGVNFFTNPEPGPGNVALCVTQTCKK